MLQALRLRKAGITIFCVEREVVRTLTLMMLIFREGGSRVLVISRRVAISIAMEGFTKARNNGDTISHNVFTYSSVIVAHDMCFGIPTDATSMYVG